MHILVGKGQWFHRCRSHMFTDPVRNAAAAAADGESEDSGTSSA